MLPGFNHNIKVKGRAFHVQTEDSGRGNPWIVTHLFVGGNIVATKRTGYKELVEGGAKDLVEQVRRRMEDQHKAMLRSLVKGEFDETLAHGAYQPGQLDATASSPAVMMTAAAKKKPEQKPAGKGMGGFLGELVSARGLDELVLEFLGRRR